jgi:Xaa-Pro aminopeptidase
MNATVYLERMKKIREGMAKAGIDVFLVGPSSNLFYLTGYGAKGDERLLLLALPREGEPFILANLLYKEQVKSLPAADFAYWKDGEDPFGLLKKEIEKRNWPVKKAALEPQIPTLFSLPISRAFPEAQFVLGSSLTDSLRQVKDSTELDLIRRASRESDRALAAVIDRGAYWIGKTELEFCGELFAELQRGGLSSPGAAVAVGANAAVPHHSTGKTVIERGKCLLIDFWSRLEGYYTDCTRTFHFGPPDREFEKIHSIVLEAHLAAEAAVRIGNTLGDVDNAARSVITRHGYGEYFTHRTGHGLGIDVHEGDSVNTGVETPIVPGMVFSIEPGIYFPGRFGVRIENLVITGEKGAEPLHAYPRELKVIG